MSVSFRKAGAKKGNLMHVSIVHSQIVTEGHYIPGTMLDLGPNGE